jgi:hypothetical protein
MPITHDTVVEAIKDKERLSQILLLEMQLMVLEGQPPEPKRAMVRFIERMRKSIDLIEADDATL